VVHKKIKEFLKPDWRKVLIAFILCGIIFGLLYCFSESECLSKTAVNLIGGPDAFFESLFDLFLFLDISIAEKVSTVIISYLLSCSIIYLYDKHKKK
jgi:hypothetical protein